MRKGGISVNECSRGILKVNNLLLWYPQLGRLSDFLFMSWTSVGLLMSRNGYFHCHCSPNMMNIIFHVYAMHVLCLHHKVERRLKCIIVITIFKMETKKVEKWPYIEALSLEIQKKMFLFVSSKYCTYTFYHLCLKILIGKENHMEAQGHGEELKVTWCKCFSI